MPDELQVGELKDAAALIGESRKVFVYHPGMQGYVVARSAYVVTGGTIGEPILVIDTRHVESALDATLAD